VVEGCLPVMLPSWGAAEGLRPEARRHIEGTRSASLDYGPYVVEVSEANHAWSGTARVVRDGDVVDERSSGFVAGPGSARCHPRTRFQAGSISKLVLSVVVLELAQRNDLHLRTPVVDWLDDAPEQWRTVTLHHLLSHTSGLGHWGDIPGLPPILSNPPPRDDLVGLIADAPLVHSPGRGWRYSGPGFVVAALVIEAATHRTYGEVATDSSSSRRTCMRPPQAPSLTARATSRSGITTGSPWTSIQASPTSREPAICGRRPMTWCV
jgi:CubicO group peptidase (beta-lactamase class C family)